MELRYHIRDILNAYRRGLFPMAEDAGADSFFFYEPEKRGLLPINGFHIPKSLSKTIRQGKYDVSANRAFRDVISGCAAPTAYRPKTWINTPIKDIFNILHQANYAHSIEVWDKDGLLVGGLYGLALGGVFFGESMFSRSTDASKVALVHLMARLWKGGYILCDIQFLNTHLSQFGAYEIPQAHYIKLLEKALSVEGKFIKFNTPDEFDRERKLAFSYIHHLKIQKK